MQYRKMLQRRRLVRKTLREEPREKDTDGTGKEAAGADSLKVGNPLVDAARILKLQRMIDEKHFEEADLYGQTAFEISKASGTVSKYDFPGTSVSGADRSLQGRRS